MTELHEEDRCPDCSAWHGVPPLQHLWPGVRCGHNRDAPCRSCGGPVGSLSVGGHHICSACDAGLWGPEGCMKACHKCGSRLHQRPSDGQIVCPHCENPPTNREFQTVLAGLDRFPREYRLKILNEYCHVCGGPSGCSCMRDD